MDFRLESVFFDEAFDDASCFLPLGGAESAMVLLDSVGVAKVRGSFISKFPKRTESMMLVKFRMVSSTDSRVGSDMHSSSQS